MGNRLASYHEGVKIELFVTDCDSCGTIFAITRALEHRRREDHKSLYCPNGHSMAFSADNETEKLQKLLDGEKKRHGGTRESLDASREVAQREKRRAAAAKGQLTKKMRKRVAAGLCPDGSCHVEFRDIRDHIHAEHPELVDQMEMSNVI